jgi:hypothetical protein
LPGKVVGSSRYRDHLVQGHIVAGLNFKIASPLRVGSFAELNTHKHSTQKQLHELLAQPLAYAVQSVPASVETCGREQEQQQSGSWGRQISWFHAVRENLVVSPSFKGANLQRPQD